LALNMMFEWLLQMPYKSEIIDLTLARKDGSVASTIVNCFFSKIIILKK